MATVGYSKTEVKRWLIRLRNPATHVDRPGRSGIVLEVDLRSVIGRMTMAAYDVLLNKRNWGDRSVDRRDVWRPDTGVLGPNGDQVFVRQHSTPAPLEAQMLDGFGAFPLSLATGGPRLSNDCWPTAPTITTAPIAGGVRVVPGTRSNRRGSRLAHSRPDDSRPDDSRPDDSCKSQSRCGSRFRVKAGAGRGGYPCVSDESDRWPNMSLVTTHG